MRAIAAVLLATSVAGLSATGPVAAQAWPSRPVRIVVGFPPGGPTDVVTRLVGQKIAEALGQPVVVDNRPGAGGVLATESVAKAAPDGYTLLMGTIGGLTVSQHLQANLPYDTLRDLAPISLVVANTNFLVLHPTVPVRNVKEFIALARARPGQLNYASSGNGTVTHLSGELFKTLAKVSIIHVPYKGGSPALNALIGGEVDLSFENALVVLPHVRSGKLRALAVTGARRAKATPEIPTMHEAGLPGYEATGWYGLLAPAAVSRDVVNRIHAETARALRIPDIVAKLQAQGSEPVGNTPDEFTRFIRNESEKWGRVVRSAGMRVD